MGSRNQRNGNRHSNNKSENRDIVNIESIKREAGDDVIIMVGQVLAILPNATFTVELENGQKIFCHVSGKIRKNRIKIILRDKVVVEISKYDLNNGRIDISTKGRIVLRTK